VENVTASSSGGLAFPPRVARPDGDNHDDDLEAVLVIDVGEELHAGGPTGGPRHADIALRSTIRDVIQH
jgi:hypothetical protein